MSDDTTQLASDGGDVLPGTEAPTNDELLAHAARSDDEQAAHIDAHIAEVGAWKAAQ